jgi:hypothetical protein
MTIQFSFDAGPRISLGLLAVARTPGKHHTRTAAESVAIPATTGSAP